MKIMIIDGKFIEINETEYNSILRFLSSRVKELIVVSGEGFGLKEGLSLQEKFNALDTIFDVLTKDICISVDSYNDYGYPQFDERWDETLARKVYTIDSNIKWMFENMSHKFTEDEMYEKAIARVTNIVYELSEFSNTMYKEISEIYKKEKNGEQL